MESQQVEYKKSFGKEVIIFLVVFVVSQRDATANIDGGRGGRPAGQEYMLTEHGRACFAGVHADAEDNRQ